MSTIMPPYLIESHGVCFFRVYGEPVTQGSKTAFVPKGGTRPVVVEQGRAKLKPWRQEVSAVAKDAMGDNPPVEGVPVAVRITFFVKRPKAAKSALHSPKRPDIDKLTRAVLDSLTSIAYKDDGQVAELRVTKLYADDVNPVGAHITVERLL